MIPRSLGVILQEVLTTSCGAGALLSTFAVVDYLLRSLLNKARYGEGFLGLSSLGRSGSVSDMLYTLSLVMMLLPSIFAAMSSPEAVSDVVKTS